MYGDEQWRQRRQRILSRQSQFRSWFPKGTYILVCVKTGAYATAAITADTQGGQIAAMNNFCKKYGLSPYREYIGMIV
jgi:hypothetical protein